MFPGFSQSARIAYFSMEIGLDSAIPTYSGGLGVLAGDSLRAAADLGLPMVAVTLLYRQGYFQQHLDAAGHQTETPADWDPGALLQLEDAAASVTIEGRTVSIRAWRYDVVGVSGHTVPVYMLDTSLPDNDERDRALTGALYGGDAHYRLCQEVVLGMGGIAMLRALGHDQIETYHMNEGHSALLSLALLEESNGSPASAGDAEIESVRERCVFTVHTPVAAGHDRFPLELVDEVLGPEAQSFLARVAAPDQGTFNLTQYAVYISRSTNAVSMRHAQVSQVMFPQAHVTAITNGVHAATWVCPQMAAVFDMRFPDWRWDNGFLRYAAGIPLEDVREAHAAAKGELLSAVNRRSGRSLDPSVLTIGFARRATEYKRADLIFSDLTRLRRIARRGGPLQLIYAGKAHPNDGGGKEIIQRIFKAAAQLKGALKVVYLEDYSMAIAKQLVAGVDVWLNTPQKPLEASGTSGMKAALNGVPSLSVLDGWWIEGHLEGVTGWAIGDDAEDWDTAKEAASLYDKLEMEVLPLFYKRPKAFAEIMRNCISINGSFFNTQRMMLQYDRNVYTRRQEGAVS